jgi:hypothetical protein
MSLYDDSQCIWVAPGVDSDGEGTFASPFNSMNKALECAGPGQTIVVARGEYSGDVTIEKSGTIQRPLRIIAEEPGTVSWIGSCWYFYDVCDVICSGFVFKDAPGMAISVVGACCRNRFDTLSFIDCGFAHEESGTFFLGGGGQSCNILELCNFFKEPSSAGASVAVLISEGDTQGASPNCNVIVNNTIIENYSYGILVGTNGTEFGQYGHQITNNTITHCSAEGIMVKCGDTLVRDNTITDCIGNGISIIAGNDSVIENNRIVDTALGVRVTGNGHTVTNNCIVRSSKETLQVIADTHALYPYESALFVENNTFVQWAISAEASAGIFIGTAITCIIRHNIFYGAGSPVAMADSGVEGHTHFVDDNIVSGECLEAPGCRKESIVFASLSTDDFTTDFRYGAQGWMLTHDTSERDKTMSFVSAAASGIHEHDIDESTDSSTEDESGGDAYSALYSWFGTGDAQNADDEHADSDNDQNSDNHS